LVSVVIVLSIPGVGPLQVVPPVGGGEAHVSGSGVPTCCRQGEVFSSNEFFSITTSRSISITTSFTLLSSFDLLSFSSDLPLHNTETVPKAFSKKKENLR